MAKKFELQEYEAETSTSKVIKTINTIMINKAQGKNK